MQSPKSWRHTQSCALRCVCKMHRCRRQSATATLVAIWSHCRPMFPTISGTSRRQGWTDEIYSCLKFFVPSPPSVPVARPAIDASDVRTTLRCRYDCYCCGFNCSFVFGVLDATFKVKGQLVADVLNSQYARTGATWQINTKILLCRNSPAIWRINVKILSTCRGRRHIVSPRALLV